MHKLPKKTLKGWDCYRGLEREVKHMEVALPLSQGLRSDNMRERHWRALAAACHVHFGSGSGIHGGPPPPFPNVSLGSVLNLGIHAHGTHTFGLGVSKWGSQQNLLASSARHSLRSLRFSFPPRLYHEGTPQWQKEKNSRILRSRAGGC